MPRKKRSKQQRAKARSKQNGNSNQPGSRQGFLSNLVDLGADTIKGIGRGVLPGLFKTQMTTAPNTVGIVAPRAVFKTSSQAQKLAEFDPERSIRITGNGLFQDDIRWPPGAQASLGCFLPVPDVNPNPTWRGISPMSVDPRAFQLVSCYQFYAFRMIRLTYIPETSTAGEKAEQSLVLAFSQDAQEYTDLPDPSATQLMEQNISILTPIWSPCTLTYTHDGTKVWRVNPAAEGTVDEMVQCLLGGRVSTRNPFTGDPIWPFLGRLYVEYVLDCYEPQPVTDQGGYTVALPYVVGGDGFIYGTSFQGPGIFEYPLGYNGLIFPPTGIDPPADDVPGPEALARTLLPLKFTRQRGQSLNPRSLLHRITELEKRLASEEEKFPDPPQLVRQNAMLGLKLTTSPDHISSSLSTPVAGESTPDFS